MRIAGCRGAELAARIVMQVRIVFNNAEGLSGISYRSRGGFPAVPAVLTQACSTGFGGGGRACFEVIGAAYYEVFPTRFGALLAAFCLAARRAKFSGRTVEVRVPVAWGETVVVTPEVAERILDGAALASGMRGETSERQAG